MHISYYSSTIKRPTDNLPQSDPKKRKKTTRCQCCGMGCATAKCNCVKNGKMCGETCKFCIGKCSNRSQ